MYMHISLLVEKKPYRYGLLSPNKRHFIKKFTSHHFQLRVWPKIHIKECLAKNKSELLKFVFEDDLFTSMNSGTVWDTT